MISSQSITDGINLSVSKSKLVYCSLIFVDNKVELICLLTKQQLVAVIIIIIIFCFLNLGRSSRGGKQKLILEIIALMVKHPSGSHQQSSRAAG